VLQPRRAPMASAWGTERRIWSPAGHLFIPLWGKSTWGMLEQLTWLRCC